MKHIRIRSNRDTAVDSNDTTALTVLKQQVLHMTRRAHKTAPADLLVMPDGAVQLTIHARSISEMMRILTG